MASFSAKREAVAKELERLKSTWVNPQMLEQAETERVLGKAIEREYSLAQLLSRPDVRYDKLMTLTTKEGRAVSETKLMNEAQIEQVDIALKYSGYIDRQKEEIARTLANETMVIPSDLDYDAVSGLSFEIRQKLKVSRPMTLGQMGRISGVTPAAVSLLLIYLKRKYGSKH